MDTKQIAHHHGYRVDCSAPLIQARLLMALVGGDRMVVLRIPHTHTHTHTHTYTESNAPFRRNEGLKE